MRALVTNCGGIRKSKRSTTLRLNSLSIFTRKSKSLAKKPTATYIAYVNERHFNPPKHRRILKRQKIIVKSPEAKVSFKRTKIKVEK